MTPDQIAQLSDIHSGVVWLWLSVLPVFGIALAVILVYVEKIHRLAEQTHREVTRDEPCGCEPCELMRATFDYDAHEHPADMSPDGAKILLGRMYNAMRRDDRRYADGTD